MADASSTVRSRDYWFQDGDTVLSVTEYGIEHKFRNFVTLSNDSVDSVTALLSALYVGRRRKRTRAGYLGVRNFAPTSTPTIPDFDVGIRPSPPANDTSPSSSTQSSSSPRLMEGRPGKTSRTLVRGSSVNSPSKGATVGRDFHLGGSTPQMAHQTFRHNLHAFQQHSGALGIGLATLLHATKDESLETGEKVRLHIESEGGGTRWRGRRWGSGNIKSEQIDYAVRRMGMEMGVRGWKRTDEAACGRCIVRSGSNILIPN
ncbi:hypothetical protein JB92DRAFT_3098870 [Gautieria morchelliformis]|nr:hypothetical protein JB92DRAFT_3098870 [Gautieria morchelliformis]